MSSYTDLTLPTNRELDFSEHSRYLQDIHAFEYKFVTRLVDESNDEFVLKMLLFMKTHLDEIYQLCPDKQLGEAYIKDYFLSLIDELVDKGDLG